MPDTKPTASPLITPLKIEERILVLRGERVLIDADLAALYGVETRRLNEQVRRNRARFPADFIFELTREEYQNLKSQFATSSWGGKRKPPLAFTEHGAIQAATVLNSSRAVEMSVYVVRAFVQLRQVLLANQDLASRLNELEHEVMRLSVTQENSQSSTKTKLLKQQNQLETVFETLRELMRRTDAAPEPPKRPIGFVTYAEKE